MNAELPDWIANVPMKTVGVLCASHIFGKNIESRQVLLSGKRYLYNAVENVVGYVLNPILPRVTFDPDDENMALGEAGKALRNIRDCFNYIFLVQVEYFKILRKIWPDRFKMPGSGADFNINMFSAKGPTLINSERRYLILSKIDGAQPFDLKLDWNADFDWVEDNVRRYFRRRLRQAQEAYANTVELAAWYSGCDKGLIIPLKTIMDDLSRYFEHLGRAAYFMARKEGRENAAPTIREHLVQSVHHLEQFIVDMLRLNVYTIIKHDKERLSDTHLAEVIRVRSTDESYGGQEQFETLRESYLSVLDVVYQEIAFRPAATVGA